MENLVLFTSHILCVPHIFIKYSSVEGHLDFFHSPSFCDRTAIYVNEQYMLICEERDRVFGVYAQDYFLVIW